MKKLLFFILVFCYPYSAFTQNITLGNDTTINHCQGCVLLKAQIQNAQLGADSYTYTQIPYDSFPYTGAYIVDYTNHKYAPGFIQFRGEAMSGITSLSFDFCFYDHSYNEFIVAVGGAINFNTVYADTIAASGLFSGGIPLPLPNFLLEPLRSNAIFIALASMRLDTPQTSITYQVYGTAPHRAMVVSWKNLAHYYNWLHPAINTFQAVLYEGSNIIRMNIEKSVADTIGNYQNGQITQGIASTDYYNFIIVNNRQPPNPPWNANQESWLFIPQDHKTYWYDMQGNCIDSLHDSITVCPPVGTTQYIAKVHAKLCGGPWIWMSDTVAITRADSLYITQTQVQHVSCYGAGDGSAQVILHGGLPPYTYTLNGNVVNNIQGLAPGKYSLVLSDKGGCKDSTVFVVTEPNTLSVDVSNVIHETCFAAHDAVVSVMAQGGTAPYTFAINNGNWQSDSIFSQLAAGTYTLSVKDIHNCTASTIVQINGALAPLSVHKDIVPNTCKTNFDASIQLNISGGTAPYFVLWHTNPPRNGNYIANLQNGSYPFTINDSRNCILIDSVILFEAKSCAFFEPNAFTPNGDGINDVFRLSEYCGGIIAFEMKIFNRWGNHIFTSRDITIGWDGKINGKEQSSDIYYYTVSYTCNENNNGTHHRMNGAFYLVR